MNPGRNDPCLCGSGDKFKKCCGKPEGARVLGSPPVGVDQLVLWMNGGRYAEVESATHAMLARQPSSATLWKLHAAALRRQGRDAFDALRRSAQLLPGDPEVQLQYGHELLDRGESAKAADVFRRTIKLAPQSAEGHDSLGLALLATGNATQAAESHRRALQLDPDRAELHGNLGNALCELGQHDAAIEHYRVMLARRPDLAEAHNNLGNALLVVRRYDEAARSYAQALALSPDAPGALFNLASVLREGGHPLEALGPCQRLLVVRPQADAWRLLGHLQSDLGDLDRASESYRRALELEAGSVETLLGLGKILRRMGRLGEAETCSVQAVELSPNSGDALTLLAQLRADQAQFGEAERLLRRAIAVSPGEPEAWVALALHHPMQDAAPEWLTAVQGLLCGRLAPAQAINLHFALGKYHDDRSEFEAAFTHIRQAHELQRPAGPAYDRAGLEQQVDRIVATFDAAWLAAHRPTAPGAPRPVFIVGMPRSGTSLAAQRLAAHPGAQRAGELRYWPLAAARYAAAALSGTAVPEMLRALGSDYRMLLDGLADGASRVIDTMPANFMHLGLLQAALPEARIIHLRRDPLDVGLSLYFQGLAGTHAYSRDLGDIAHYYGQYQRVMHHWQAILGPNAILELQYELLVRNPEQETRRLLAFVGLPWDPRCVESRATERTASPWQMPPELDARGIGRWRNYVPHLGPLQGLQELSA